MKHQALSSSTHDTLTQLASDMSLLLKDKDTEAWRGRDPAKALNLGSGKAQFGPFLSSILWGLTAKELCVRKKDKIRKISLEKWHLSRGEKESMV